METLCIKFIGSGAKTKSDKSPKNLPKIQKFHRYTIFAPKDRIMKKIIIFIPFLLMAFNLKQQFLKKHYESVCNFGFAHIKRFKNNENILSLIGLACVKSDNLFRLDFIASKLKNTPLGRKNGVYFSLLFFEKKLLQAYLFDKIDLSYYQLPHINHPISVVLQNILHHNFTKQNNQIIIKSNNLTYKVYTNKQNRYFIDIYKNNTLIQTHWYK